MESSGGSSSRWKIAAAVFGVIVLAVVVAAAAYIFWINDDDGGTATGVQVTAVLISNEIDAGGQPVNPRLALPAGSRAVRASVRLTGATVGTKVTGTWF